MNISCVPTYVVLPAVEADKFNVVLKVPEIRPDWAAYSNGAGIILSWNNTVVLKNLSFDEATTQLKYLRVRE